MHESGTSSGCSANIRSRLARRHGQDQLEIFAIAQGVVKGGRAVGEAFGQSPGVVADRHGPGPDDRPAAAFDGQMRQIERQPVAAIDAGVQLVSLVEQQGFGHARLEIEVMAEDAAAERAGDDDAVAGPGPAAEERTAGGRSAQEGDAQGQRAVPGIRVAAGNRQIVRFRQRQEALVELWANSMPPCRGRTAAITPASGLAAIAARSLRLTARALRPTRRGSSRASSKST